LQRLKKLASAIVQIVQIHIARVEDSQDLQRGTKKVKEPCETGAFYAKVCN
jgi:hypothetical protein